MLERRGFIRRVKIDQANPQQDARGVEFEMLLPAAASTRPVAAPPRVAPPRNVAPTPDVANKESIKTKNSKEEIKENPPVTDEEKEAYRVIHGREWSEKSVE